MVTGLRGNLSTSTLAGSFVWLMFYPNEDLPDSRCHACMAGCQAELLCSPAGDTACGGNKTHCIVLVCHSTGSYLLLLLCRCGHGSIMRPVSGGMCTHRSSLTLGSSECDYLATMHPKPFPLPQKEHVSCALFFTYAPFQLEDNVNNSNKLAA